MIRLLFGIIFTFIIYQAIFNQVKSQNIKEDIQLKGGLVFKPEGLAQINQDYMQFIRSIDTTALQTFAQQAYSAIQLYSTFCNVTAELNKRNTNNDTVPLPFKRYLKISNKQKLSSARSVCSQLNAQLPEIRDSDDLSKLREYAHKNEVQKISAGVYYDSSFKILRFISDHSEATRPALFKSIFYGGSYTGMRHHGNWQDPHVHTALKSYPVIYVTDETVTSLLRISLH